MGWYEGKLRVSDENCRLKLLQAYMDSMSLGVRWGKIDVGKIRDVVGSLIVVEGGCGVRKNRNGDK